MKREEEGGGGLGEGHFWNIHEIQHVETFGEDILDGGGGG